MTTSDKIVAFMSCVALVVSVIQTRIIQKQPQAAVWSRLANGQGSDLIFLSIPSQTKVWNQQLFSI